MAMPFVKDELGAITHIVIADIRLIAPSVLFGQFLNDLLCILSIDAAF